MRFFPLPLLVATLGVNAADFLPPEESAKAFQFGGPGLAMDLVLAEPDIAQPVFINWDERGRLWVCEYRQYPAPAGLSPVSHDEFWRTVYDKVPPPPPHGTPGADRISIHEDADGDGKYEKHTVFLDGLNLCTAVEHGRGGHFVLQPPYLLFYADADRDDQPDGPPEVLLSGFGIEDTHSIANSLRWGPDGWLYAAHGSTVTSRLKRPGDKAPVVEMIGQGIWRYHPESRRVEVFAEGGGNTFGVELDAQGRLFSGHNGGDTRGFYYMPGGYLRKGFEKHGPLSNPYAFGYFNAMNSHKTERFTHNFIVYEGGAFGQSYEGKMFAIEPMQGRIILCDRLAEGSTFSSRDLGRIITSDRWFRPVDIKAGPDGAVYIADFHEPEISHLKHRSGPVAKNTGRVWRLRTPTLATAPVKDDELKKKPSLKLFDVLTDSNKWRRQTALRVIADHRAALLEELNARQHAAESETARAIREKRNPKSQGGTALSAYLCDGKIPAALFGDRNFDVVMGLEALHPLEKAREIDDDLKHAGRDVGLDARYFHTSHRVIREWAVRIVAERMAGEPYPRGQEHLVELRELAAREPSLHVRVQLAASARRLPARPGLAILRELFTHDQDAGDPCQPLMLWWALESKCTTDRDEVLALFEHSPVWDRPLVRDHLLERLMRRFAHRGTQPDLLACARLLNLAPGDDHAKRLLAGFEAAFKGRSLTGLPDELAFAISRRGGASLPLRLRLGETEARQAVLTLLADSKAAPEALLEILPVLAEIKLPEARELLLARLELPGDDAPPRLRAAFLAALGPFDEPAIAERLLRHLKTRLQGLSGPRLEMEAADALALLATRAGWSRQVADAVKAGDLPREAVSLAIVRRLKLHQDAALLALANELWPGTGSPGTAEMEKTIGRLNTAAQTTGGDPYRGRALYDARCAACHRLHGEGGQIGPDLTSYQREDLPALLTAIVNPSAEIREGYENLTLTTRDGRTLAGFLAERDEKTVTLRGLDGQSTVLPTAEIARQAASGSSLMPENLLLGLDDTQIRDFFAYLRSTQPLPGKRK